MKFSILLLLLAATLVYGCERKPYVEHKLKFEKVSDDCKDKQSYFRLNSNFGGERFEFEKCLPAGFNAAQLVSSRSNDTVYIAIKTGDASANDKVFHLTLDVDAYPKYNFITIGDDTYAITPSQQ